MNIASTPLREKMIRAMKWRHLSPKTIEAYVSQVQQLARHYGRCPSQLSAAEIEAYLFAMIEERCLAWKTVNQAAHAIRFLYREVLERETAFKIPPRKSESRLPEVLSLAETRRLIDAPFNLKHRAILHTVYGCGLRLNETVHLKVKHIESERMLVRVEQGKGRKDRYTILPKCTLQVLREYYRRFRPDDWLFYGRDTNQPLSDRTPQRIFRAAKEKAGITRGRGIHTLRHCFATHLLSAGTDVQTVQHLLGHRNLSTTLVYLHVIPGERMPVHSPLDEPAAG